MKKFGATKSKGAVQKPRTYPGMKGTTPKKYIDSTIHNATPNDVSHRSKVIK